MSGAEEYFALQLRALKLPEPVREYRPHAKRRWRIDFAWPELMLAVEIEGGVHSGGRHVRGKGFEGDAEKYNCLTELGWQVLRFTPKHLRSGEAVAQVERIINRLSAA